MKPPGIVESEGPSRGEERLVEGVKLLVGVSSYDDDPGVGHRGDGGDKVHELARFDHLGRPGASA